ncbi:MAG: hypothetical protein ACTSWY_03470 [Promethearchaeota archaeon]
MQRSLQKKKSVYDKIWKELYPNFVESNKAANKGKLRKIKRTVIRDLERKNK